MSIITPSDEALGYLSELVIGQQRFDISEQSDTSGHTATRLGGPPRWTAALRTLDAMELQIAALWKVIAVQLRGRVNHLALYDITQPVPRGEFRGTVTLGVTSSAGSTSLTLSGCRGANAVLGGSFEVDTNADGLADGWSRFSTGSTGTLNVALGSFGATDGSQAQWVTASALAAGDGNRQGVQQTDVPVAHLAGKVVTLAANALGTSGIQIAVYVAWYDGGGSPVGSPISASITGTAAAQTIAASGTCPSSAVTAAVQVYQYNGAGGVASLHIDAVRMVEGSASASYPSPANLLAGDWLQIGSGVGSHYCMVTADATANDAGSIAVSIEPPLRKAFTGGTSVTWDKPKGHYKQRPDSVTWSGVAGASGAGGFALDLVEDWSA